MYRAYKYHEGLFAAFGERTDIAKENSVALSN